MTVIYSNHFSMWFQKQLQKQNQPSACISVRQQSQRQRSVRNRAARKWISWRHLLELLRGQKYPVATWIAHGDTIERRFFSRILQHDYTNGLHDLLPTTMMYAYSRTSQWHRMRRPRELLRVSSRELKRLTCMLTCMRGAGEKVRVLCFSYRW